MTDRSPEARLRQLIERWRNFESYVPGSEHRRAWMNAARTCATELEALLTEDAATRPAHNEQPITVVVNGQPVTVPAGPVRAVIQAATKASGQIGAPVSQWELRTREGDVIPQTLPEEWHLSGGTLIFMNLGLPPGTEGPRAHDRLSGSTRAEALEESKEK